MTVSAAGTPPANDLTTDRPLYRVGLYVEMDAEGGDYVDAAMGAAQALRRATVPSPFRQFPDAVFRVVEAMEVGMAAGNWKLLVVPPHRVMRGEEWESAALVSEIDRKERERAEQWAREEAGDGGG